MTDGGPPCGGDYTELKEAAEEVIEHPCSSKARHRLGNKPRTILALITDLEAAEELLRDREEDVAHEFGLRNKAEHDLATANKLINDYKKEDDER